MYYTSVFNLSVLSTAPRNKPRRIVPLPPPLLVILKQDLSLVACPRLMSTRVTGYNRTWFMPCW